jgi:hypothetical protein
MSEYFYRSRRKGQCNVRPAWVPKRRYGLGSASRTIVACEYSKNKGTFKNSPSLYLKRNVLHLCSQTKTIAHLAILYEGMLIKETILLQCPFHVLLTVKVSISLVVEESPKNSNRGRTEPATPLADTLISLDNALSTENSRARRTYNNKGGFSCHYSVWNPCSVYVIPYFLHKGDGFIILQPPGFVSNSTG